MTSSTRTSTTRPSARPTVRRTLLLAACAVAIATLAACTDDGGWGAPPGVPGGVSAEGVSLVRSSADCETLVEAARTDLDASIEATWNAPTTTIGRSMQEDSSATQFSAEAAPTDGAAGSAGSADATASLASGSASDEVVGTNNQEASVDEGDLIKTDGTRIVTVVDGILRVTVLDGSPTVDGTLDLTGRQPTQLFLRGDEAVLIGTTYGQYLPADIFIAEGSADASSSASGTAGSSSAGSSSAGSAGEIAEEPVTAEAAPPSTATAATTVPVTTVVPATTTTAAPTTTTTTAVPSPTEPAPTPTVPRTTPTTTPATTTTVVDPAPVPSPEPLPEPSPEPLPAPVLPPAPFPVTTTVTRVSLADPAAPVVVESADLEGSLVAARLIDGRIRLVLRSEPQAMAMMSYATDLSSATAIVDDLDESDLLPRIEIDGRVERLGGCGDVLLTPTSTATSPVATSGPVGGCDPAACDIAPSMPSQPALSTVTVATIGDTLTDLQPISVQGAADVAYASTGSLVVAAQNWSDQGHETVLHRFDLTGDGAATYTGSGVAPGWLLGQYSLSERDGALRVVTTVDPSWSRGIVDDGIVEDDATTFAPAGVQAGRLTVLDTDGALDEIGHLDGLGANEQVKSVRFIDDLAYVVTFRQTDPLFALDLGDPRDPRVLGELKVPGFSEYLHPVGDGLLLGVGREVDPATQQDLGLKISLFDISDPAQMVEVDRQVIENGSSAVEYDPLAFTWDPSRSQAVIPFSGGCSPNASCMAPTSAPFRVVGVQDGRLVTTGQFAHPLPATGWFDGMYRSVIVGGDLWTVSSAGLGRSDADASTSVELLAF